MGDARRALFNKSENDDLPIRIGIQRLYKELILAISRFPKIHKPTIGVDVREKISEFRNLINRAARLTNRMTALRDADIALQDLRFQYEY